MIDLPPTVQQVLPILASLNSEQKAFIQNFLNDSQTPNNANLAWQMGQDVFGNYHSGHGDLSAQAKSLVKQKIQAKYGKNTD